MLSLQHCRRGPVPVGVPLLALPHRRGRGVPRQRRLLLLLQLAAADAARGMQARPRAGRPLRLPPAAAVLHSRLCLPEVPQRGAARGTGGVLHRDRQGTLVI